MIAALFVAKAGCYFGIDGVDPWDEERDARTYAGPHPIVAHPPCQLWTNFAALAVGTALPELVWGASEATHQVGWFDRIKPSLSKREASATPPAFRDLLLSVARSVRPQSEAA